ncbi:MAG: hypothetical protein WAM60_26920 [Candidatus Promineifilaceae bacterium]
MQFKTIFFWEFIQNLPLVAGLLAAIQLWQDSAVVAAVGTMFLGALLGATLIRLTEGKIVSQRPNHGLEEYSQEPVSVTVTNIALMFFFSLALTIYLTADWSSFLTDLLAGGLIGFALSAGQSKAARSPVSIRHSLAFAAAFPAALITVRLLSAVFPIAISILVTTMLVTGIITLIDYGHLSTIKEGAN